MLTGDITIRVRYSECDPMGVAHHTAYPVWLEMGRTELLRATGQTYREFEQAGIFLAVIELALKYRRPARYDDVLTLRTTLSGTSRVKIEHRYELYRGEELLATASTMLACLDRAGRATPLPENIALDGRA